VARQPRAPGHRLRRAAAWLLVAIGASACGRVPDRSLASPGALRGANVLLITIDTLRQDRLGAFGSTSGLTPNLDALAARGVRYSEAFTPAPLTLPAHASILTGLLPRRHGIHNNTSFRLDERVPTLPAILRQHDYRTGAFVGAFVLDGRFGLSRGFDEYDDRLPPADRATFHSAERRGEVVVAHAGDWILRADAAARKPWLAWLHLFDPHAPYDAPAEYRQGRLPYDAEVAYTDAMIGRLLQRLQQAHALDRTLVIVTADHGESLGEHGETTHGLFAYNATLAVPLLMAAPVLGHNDVDLPVSHVDLAPTILDLLGLDVPAGLDGQSLARSPRPDRALFFEALDASITRGWAPLVGVVQNGWKYIDLPEPELYDLSHDPHEQTNRGDADAHAEPLRRALRAAAPAAAARSTVALDADATARLRALGYTSGAASRKPVTADDDPKRLVALNEHFNTALTLFDQGRSDEALAGFQAIVRKRPDFVTARASAATVLVAEGRPRDAVDLLRAGLAIDPQSPLLLAKLGSALRAAGDLQGSAGALERARREGDQSPDALNDLAVAYAGLGRLDAARAAFTQLVDLNPASPTTWYNVGLFELQAKRPDAAAAAFTRATALDPGYGAAWQALGAALLNVDRPRAIAAWRTAERLLPGDYDLLFNLGMVLADSNSPIDAVPYLTRFAKEAPPQRYARDVGIVRATLARVERRTP